MYLVSYLLWIDIPTIHNYHNNCRPKLNITATPCNVPCCSKRARKLGEWIGWMEGGKDTYQSYWIV